MDISFGSRLLVINISAFKQRRKDAFSLQDNMESILLNLGPLPKSALTDNKPINIRI